MARLRYDGLKATLNASLTDTGTTITFAAKLTAISGDIPTIASPDYLPLTIVDPDNPFDSEIVYLTAYTSGGVSGTMSRGEENSTAVAWAGTEEVRNGPTKKDFTTLEVTVSSQAGTSYTVDEDDDGSIVRFTNASAVTVTLPDGLPIGFIVELLSWGAAGLSVQDNGTSTVQQEGTISQYEAVSCVVVATDTWSVVGPVA